MYRSYQEPSPPLPDYIGNGWKLKDGLIVPNMTDMLPARKAIVAPGARVKCAHALRTDLFVVTYNINVEITVPMLRICTILMTLRVVMRRVAIEEY